MLAISCQNVAVFSPSSSRPSLHAYPIPNSPQDPKPFTLPLPPFPLPHSEPTHLSFSPNARHFLAFFPLASPEDSGGTLALWDVRSTGHFKYHWVVREWWALSPGDQLIDSLWLGADREWTVSSPDSPSINPEQSSEDGHEIASPSNLLSFHRLPYLGPPILPTSYSSPSSSSTALPPPPTFIALTASHSIILYHPHKQQPALRFLQCKVDGPSSSVWGITPDESLAALKTEVEGENRTARGKRRRIRRGKLWVRAEGTYTYVLLQSVAYIPTFYGLH